MKAVLCLHVETGQPLPPGGFVRFTYAQFWNQIRSSLGLYLPTANPKWVTYLIEFMTTTSNIAGENSANKEFTEFFIKYHKSIEELVKARQLLHTRLTEYNVQLKSELKSELDKHNVTSKLDITSQLAYQNRVFAVDFKIQHHIIVLDLALHLALHNDSVWRDPVWRLTVFDRNENSYEFLSSLTKTKSMQGAVVDPKNPKSYLLNDEWDIHVTQPDLQNAVMKWVNAIVAASTELASTVP